MTFLLAIVCLLLLLLSGFFSASETALMSLNRTDLKRLGESGGTGRLVCKLLRRPQRLLRTVLVGNMFVNVLLASLFAALLNELLSSGDMSVFERLAEIWFPMLSRSGMHRFDTICRMLLNILIVTPALMVFGEHTPKLIAYSKNTAISRIAAYPLAVLYVVLYPFNCVLRFISNAFLKLFGQNTDDGWEKMTADELISTISVSEESGATNEAENQMLSRIVDFGGCSVDEVMTPRMELVGLSDRLTVREAYDKARLLGHSWYPVYSGNLDGVWGMLSLVDYPYWKDRPEMEQTLAQFRRKVGHNVRLKHVVYKPKYVPATAHIDKLLKSLRQERRTIAVVVDEHGGTEGIVTLNDIVSELLGTLPDHGDNSLVWQKDGVTFADGRVHLRILQRMLGDDLEWEKTDMVTLGGAITEACGRIPTVGDAVSFPNGVTMKVAAMDGNRVKTVEIELPKKVKEDADEH